MAGSDNTVATQALPPSPHPECRPMNAGHWQGAVRLLLALGLMALLFWLMGEQGQHHWQDPQIHITANDQHYRLTPRELGELQRFSRDYIQTRSEQGQASLAAITEAHLDRLFARVEGQIPVFLDWHYSLQGEYSRMGMGLAYWLGWDEGDFVRQKAEQVLFHESHWEDSLKRLESRAMATLVREDRLTREGWMAGILERLAPHRVPAPINGGGGEDSTDRPRLSMDALQRDMAGVSLLSMNERLSLSGGGAVAGVVLWRGAARGAAALGGRRVAAQGAGRGAARIGAGAAGGALACAPGGPLALTCAVAAGTLAWVGLDWALLKGEELLGRDEMEAALQKSLAGLRQEVEGPLQGALAAELQQHHERMQQRISGHFLPLQGPLSDRQVPSEGVDSPQ
ncbi:MAG: hypothetical protein R3296_03475 [Oleiphilaceae bacterium]|nr:hypothetical protein [Oleiphilaceae bacterium]